MHTLKTTGRIRMFYMYSTYRATALLLEMSIFWVRAVCEIKISELWLQTHIADSFWYNILRIITLITQKLQVVYGHSTYWMTALLSRMPVFWVKAACKIWLARHGSKMHCKFFPIHHLLLLTHNLETTSCIWTFCLLNNCSTIEGISCVV